MTNEWGKKGFVVLFLLLLSISAGIIRFQNYRNSKLRTIDEIVYVRMAEQINRDIADYNTVPYGKELDASGRPIADYFFQPLFKHPPVFTYTLALFFKIFGVNNAAAGLVSVFLSVLMITLCYVLGATLFNQKVGLFSAFLLWVDPVSIICSQKVWMDTMIAFWTLLSVVLFVQALARERNVFFILSGVSAGLVVNTKYTGILITVAFVLYAFLYEKELFRNRFFLLCLSLPFLMLIPWIAWNAAVYNPGVLLEKLWLQHGSKEFLASRFWFLIPIGLAAVSLGFFLWRRLEKHIPSEGFETQTRSDNRIFVLSLAFCAGFLGILLGENIVAAFRLSHLPPHSWYQGFDSGRPSYFYFGQLIEFSLFYIPAFMSLFLFQQRDQPAQTALLRIPALLILFFFIAWGGYQCRYILPALPFLLILSAEFINRFMEKVRQCEYFFLRILGTTVCWVFLFYAVFRVSYVNIFLSFTNDMCYF